MVKKTHGKILFTAIIFLTFILQIKAQNTQHEKFKIFGTVYEETTRGKNATLPFATISIPDYSMSVLSNTNGNFSLGNIPSGKVRVSVSFLGKVTVDTLINVSSNLNLNFILKEENFRLQEIVVTAENSKAGQSTASKISRTAMDHLQATSLNDVLSLLPGGVTSNQTLSEASQINIRSVSANAADKNMNGLGAVIIRDGAPISNNANLQTMSPSVVGATASLGGTSSPSGGFDIRGISVDNIESIEVIRGIPSVQYGDLTSGAVILNSKAGREPLRVNAKTNPNVYEFSIGTGFELGKNRGALNISGDYAHNVTNPVRSYLYYQRAAAKVLYSNAFFNNKLRSNTSVDFLYGNNQRDLNPDDASSKIASQGKDLGVTLNTNGSYNINKGWLKEIKYVASASYTSKKSYYEEQYTNATAPYSMTTTDGAILSNTAGKDIYDNLGNKLTNFSGADANNYAIYLPNSYFAHHDIDGKEINIFGKLTTNFFKKIGNLNNKIMLGADLKVDGNEGDGKTFSNTAPPYRNLSAVNASFRPRSYKDIPYVKQLGFFAEENFSYALGNRYLNIQAGVRYDKISSVKDVITPRINASFDILPDKLTIRGGYGITAKAPTSLYLHPENAYFEYVNINEMANGTISEDQRVYMTTTRIFNTENKDLKVTKNKKAELGLDFKLGKSKFGITAFTERMNNGYGMEAQYSPVTFNEYKRSSADASTFTLSQSNPVLACYYTPSNNRTLNTKGLEFDLNLGRFDAIRTAFTLNGAWIQSESYNNDYTYFDGYSGTGGSDRTHIGVYEKGMSKSYNEQLSTTLRATHNIPSIGFVVTLTAQTIWKESNWYKFGNDTIPIKYISKVDGVMHDFKEDPISASEYTNLLRQRQDKYYIKESYSPLFCFNINVTKEIGDFLRVSFFANNMFRSYPIQKLKRETAFKVRNNQFFFGLELSLKL
ncbi:TonB-dependent receptor [uncultured Bacteroides sp.]|uniref:TonB-dependent receptor n=1 Tax=uncultured Bacteroides sp. TaxID=162156 RepID=UPI002AABF6E5|nr:TonB-dependent receptor [uncultured Bacteroides sp.]